MKDFCNLMLATLTSFILFTACDDNDNNVPNDIDEKPLSSFSQPTPNPYLAQPIYSITHFNSAQTDAFPYEVKDGSFNVNPDECPSVWAGPVSLMTLASKSPDYMWATASDRVSYVRISNGGFELIADASLPGVEKHTREQIETLVADYSDYNSLEAAVKKVLGPVPQMSMANGNYVLCDRDNYAYTNVGKILARYRLDDSSDPSKGIVLDAQLDMTSHIFGSFTLVGVSMTYDGYLIVASQKGLTTVDRSLNEIVDSYPLPEGQILTNSLSVDENGGVYVASNSTEPNGRGMMQKLICRNGHFSSSEADGAWQTSYEGGPEAPAIKLGYGTGSTPTLMGFGSEEDKLVVITDGAKRMNLVAFWRDEIPADAKEVESGNPRMAGKFPITCGLPSTTQWIQSEQSVVAGGYDAFVVNNINETAQKVSDKIVGVLAIGPIIQSPKGAECVRWNCKENKWESRWTRPDVSSISMIPSVSIPSEMVFVNGYGADGWDLTGLDWKSGATLQHIVFGKNNRGNGAYAIIQFLSDGSLLFNSVAGPFRASLK